MTQNLYFSILFFYKISPFDKKNKACELPKAISSIRLENNVTNQQQIMCDLSTLQSTTIVFHQLD
jgi:hypothetical protein